MAYSFSPWLSSLTAAELALIFCLFFVLISFVGIAVIQPFLRRMVHGKRQVNDVVIFVAANFGLVYAVLLGLMIVATFQNTKDLQDHVAMEASSLATIYSTADAYPEPLRNELRSQLRDYTHYVIQKDWPAHRDGRVLVGGAHRLETIRKELLSFETTDKSQVVLDQEMMHYFNTMNQAREERLSAVASSIPDVLWYVLIVGALGTIIFLWMLHTDLVPQLLLTGITAFFLGIMIFLIFAMDHPLQGAVSVGNAPFRSVYNLDMKWEDTEGNAPLVSLGTAVASGIYYKIGDAICDAVDRRVDTNGARCSVEETPGSVYNVEAIRRGELDFAVVQSDVAYAAYNGIGAFAGKPIRNLRTVLILYPELLTIVARADSGIRQVADLAGKRVNIGEQGSGSRATWHGLQSSAGWSAQPQTEELPPDAAARALCGGQIDASVLVVGHPSPMLRTDLALCPTRFVALSPTVVDTLVSRAPYLLKANIPNVVYGQQGATPTIGSNAVLVTSATADPKAVAALSRTIIAHVKELKAKQPALAPMTVEKMTSGNTPAPLYKADESHQHLTQEK